MPATEVPTYTRTPPPLSQEPIPTVPSTPESTPNQITMIVRNLFESPNRILRFSSQATQIVSSESDFPSSQKVMDNLDKAALLFSSQNLEEPLR